MPFLVARCQESYYVCVYAYLPACQLIRKILVPDLRFTSIQMRYKYRVTNLFQFV